MVAMDVVKAVFALIGLVLLVGGAALPLVEAWGSGSRRGPAR